MIINPTDEAALRAKQELQENEGSKIRHEVAPSSQQWPSLRNPRIVRVSRSFGGKDRHSKVCTIRGLRDRRIRLSVPTAVQLYDLQDKLGLSQPSKVIDWLLDATKEDIDKLPPLQMPQGFGQFNPQTFIESNGSRNLGDLLQLPHEPVFPMMGISTFLGKRGIDINDSLDGDGHETAQDRSSKYWNIDLAQTPKEKEVLLQQRGPLDDHKGKSIETNELQKHVGTCGHYAQLSAQNFFPVVSYSSLPQALASNAMPYSYNQWDHSNSSTSQLGGFQPITENSMHSGSVSSSSSSSALTLAGSQLYFCPPAMPSLFPTCPPHIAASSENNPLYMSHFQLPSSSSSQPIFPTSLIQPLHLINQQQSVMFSYTNTSARFHQPQENTADHTKDDEQSH
ncbi:hypothetical protein SAY86_003273 [Trapa natans]|uniref:TCP domain-containing protein n=1 Tax=Trapa natans TaxID=22666 RepID=A0AAN7MGW0_TRANT|nr:hypothetical protein SAY86_003273 [Trapa natans]